MHWNTEQQESITQSNKRKAISWTICNAKYLKRTPKYKDLQIQSTEHEKEGILVSVMVRGYDKFTEYDSAIAVSSERWKHSAGNAVMAAFSRRLLYSFMATNGNAENPFLSPLRHCFFFLNKQIRTQISSSSGSCSYRHFLFTCFSLFLWWLPFLDAKGALVNPCPTSNHGIGDP